MRGVPIRIKALAGAIACVIALSALPSRAADGFVDERCSYVQAEPPGLAGNRLEVISDYTAWLRRRGARIEVHYEGPPCTGGVPTVYNTDRIVLQGGGEGAWVDASRGAFAPGVTPERSGSEIEILVTAGRFEYQGTAGRDAIRARTLPDGHVALNVDRAADGRLPDYDVTFANGVLGLLKIRGFKGDDLIDARRLTGMGDNQLRRVIRLFGGAGDDKILGSPGSEWRLHDGPGDDLVIVGGGFDSVDFDRGHDTIYGGPGGDDLIYSTWERYSGQPPDGADRIFGGGGEDQIIDLNRHRDFIRCGSGFDEVERDSHDRPPSDCERLR